MTYGDAVFTNNAGSSFAVQSVASAAGLPVPRDFLEQNRPNPFNPVTEIAFTVSSDTHATVRVYDVSGRAVATLADAPYTAGRHRVACDGRNDVGDQVGSGVYFYRLDTALGGHTRKMILLE